MFSLNRVALTLRAPHIVLLKISPIQKVLLIEGRQERTA